MMFRWLTRRTKRDTRRSRVDAGSQPLWHRMVGHAIARGFRILRRTVWIDVQGDIRPTLRAEGQRYVIAILHANQFAALALHEPEAGALVSRSRDGQLLVPTLQACDCVPICGSSGMGRKGGGTALNQLIRHVRGGRSAVIAVDGPKGPRGIAQPGIAMTAIKADALIIPVILIANRRWIWRRSWDRLQLFKPFSTIQGRFGTPIDPSGRTIADLTDEVTRSLAELEAIVDPAEAAVTAGRSVQSSPAEVLRKAA